jgi:hypothetical protein
MPVQPITTPAADATIDDDYVVIAGESHLTDAGFARQARVSTRTVARWDARRQGPPWVGLGRRKLRRPADVHAWLAAGGVAAQSKPRHILPRLRDAKRASRRG